MPVIAGDVMARAAAFLNDVAQELYTNDVQLPYLQAANDELSDELMSAGVPVQKEVSATIQVAASAVLVNQPDDIITPIRLFERASGSSDDFIEVDQFDIEQPSWPSSTKIDWWVWREQLIRINPPSSNREVRLDYKRMILSISGTVSSIEVIGATNFLSYKTAELCARYIGQNPVVGDQLEVKAEKHLHKLLQNGVRKNQSLRTRRKPFRMSLWKGWQ